MKTLRDFLIAEARLQESEEIKVPPGFSPASTKGPITRMGVATIKQLGGEEAKYNQVKISDVTEKHIRSQFGGDASKINNLRDLVGTKGLFSNAKGAKVMQGLFTNSQSARGVDGYTIEMISDWAKIGGRPKSSQKLIMFWINALYNVYVKRDLEAVKLKFWFSNDSVLVMEP